MDYIDNNKTNTETLKENNKLEEQDINQCEITKMKDKYKGTEVDILESKLSNSNMTTKDKILYASLTLFSIRGYEGVTMRDIAAAVNIKGSSIYKHYKSKQMIFESIIEFMNQEYEKHMLELQIPVGPAEEVAKSYYDISKEDLYAIVKNIFHYFITDEYAVKYRRLLFIERYKNSIVCELFTKMYYADAFTFQNELFALLMKEGYFKKMDPQTIVLQFYSPIFLLLTIYDQYPERIKEAEVMLQNHVYQFYDSNLAHR